MTSQRKGFQPHCDSDTKIMNTNTIKIANVSNHVNRAEVVALFGTLIGDVRNTSEFRDAIGTHIEITFNTHDAAKKALCMSGYTIGGCSLVVTPVFKEDDISPKLPDSRRNLYVLGIPFDLTKSEFAAIFSRFGKVAHSVILATVDNASRRRGFVVMASHEDAKCAMRGLTHTQIKGHTIDVSWSIVQRSEGFLDGGDRATVFDSYSNSGPEITQENDAVFPSADSSETVASLPQEKSFSLTFTPTNHLLVTNLPFILFANTSDLEPLLFPFGPIKKLEMIALVSPQETSSAIVEYDALESATDAKESLQGQCYAQYRINAEYIVLPDASPIPPVPAFSEFDDFEIKFDRTLARNSFFSNSAPPSRTQSRNHSSAFQHKRPLQDISNSSNYLQHFAPPSALYAPKSGPLPRSNSSNSRWNNDPTQCYSSRIQYPYPSQMQTNGYKAQDRVVYTPVHN
ncbi:pre-mrna splicing factor [Lentinula edodes]|uniref:Pre-mrna splicing factor n=1 Tax=Lentinula edodes TaxID=5353 RepID=A0A1Q3E8A7_LENED|nr:uncharacterized protein C8R40DRAFT_1155932 [Lentinula edodes]KAH7868925.1 hypothetical protein C8R40DRAFT_1155932 [Lentinula edodes]GAW03299.1 pre-mrna splicing factor [Lentinula edodes]